MAPQVYYQSFLYLLWSVLGNEAILHEFVTVKGEAVRLSLVQVRLDLDWRTVVSDSETRLWLL